MQAAVEALNDVCLETYCGWLSAIDRARKFGRPFHDEWLDYDTFLRDVGPCPEGSFLRVRQVSRGCVPNNVHWHGNLHTGRIKERSYNDCDVATCLVKDGLLTEALAVRLASLDIDPGYVRGCVYRMREQVKGLKRRVQKKSFSDLVRNLEGDFIPVPRQDPTPWEIERMCAEIKRENEAAERDVVPELESAVASFWA